MKKSLMMTLAALLVAPMALAMPLQMPLQGVLRDNAGTPVAQGTFELTFAIYADAEAEEAMWTETREVTVGGGQFRLNLGEETPLQPSLFAASGALWLGVTVETDPELPRRPMGTTPYAFQAASAGGLACSGCVEPEALSPASLQVVREEALVAVAEAGYPMAAGDMDVDAEALGVEATTVQGALEALKGLIETQTSSSNLNEGAGTIRGYEHQWGLPSYGVAKDYVHIMHPTPPKVLLHLYGGENTGFASSNNLIVSNSYTPNTYSGIANGEAGNDTMTVNNAGAFNQGDHILIHQTMGSNSGSWELNAVQAINGNSLKLAKELVHTYVSDGATGNGMQRAQVVIAASYNTFEVVNGGSVYPSSHLSNGDGQDVYGGIVYIRARQLTVKNGGRIHADERGFDGGHAWDDWNVHNRAGHSECSTSVLNQRDANCSGGGGGKIDCCGWSNNAGGGGGGGNRTAGADGTYYGNSSYYGYGGQAKGSDGDGKLRFGGGGGTLYQEGGRGGGLVVLGADTLIVESGGRITAQGEVGQGGGTGSGGGGGAGGTVAIFASTIDNQGVIEAAGAAGGDGYSSGEGGQGGEGWVLEQTPIPGVVNQSYATGVQIWIDGQEVTPLVGDPNDKGLPHWNATEEAWGGTGTEAWSSGPLDLTNVASWTPGEHTLEFRETGGAGGDLKAYLYLIQRFSESSPPVNDTCQTPVMLDLSEGPVVVGGTTEDIMGKTLATDASSDEFCGGVGGPDVVYQITLTERSLINAVVTAPFYARLYLREGDCDAGDVAYCGANEIQTTPLEAGDYFLFVDSDADSQKGDFGLAVSLTPAPLPTQDTCDDALQLIFSEQGVATHAGSTLYGLDQYQAWCDPVGGGADVVYGFQAATGQSITIDVDAEFETLVYLYLETCGEGFPISCTDQSTLFIAPQQGGMYYLVIDGTDEKEWGTYDLTVTLQ